VKKAKKMVAVGSIVVGLMLLGTPGVASAHPSTTANCIGTANSNGQGEFASGLATTVPPGEFGSTTAEILGGGLIGSVASTNDCS
jgi:hypothetical protein